MSPFTFVPAYGLPVYASQCTLPATTQDSVRGCWLDFPAAAISDGWLTYAYMAQPCTDPTSFPAVGDLPSRPGEFHPEPLTDSGRDTLASSGSCHRLKAAAFRRDMELVL